MVAAATSRARPAARTAAGGAAPVPIASARNRRRPAGSWVLIAIPVVLALTFAWQVASRVFHSDVVTRQATAVGQIDLEPDPAGTRIDFVVVDRVGHDTTVGGSMTVKLREPDGSVWQTNRDVSPGDFQPLPDSSLLSGRVGYTVVVPAADWARPPRRGGSAKVTVEVTPDDGSDPFSAVSDQRFP